MEKSPELVALEAQDRRSNLKKFCDSILQKIRALDNNSADRAIWELCQNARDLSPAAVIDITLAPGMLTFAHQGKPFNEDSLLSLVKQVSSESKENEDAAGQFGTGFVTTHIFSRKFYLDGSFKTSSGKVFDIDHFEIDRCEDDINRFIDKMDAQIKAVFDLISQPEATLHNTTKLSYPLDDDAQKKAHEALVAAERMLPYVMVVNTCIQSVTLCYDGHSKEFSKCSSRNEADLNITNISKTIDGDKSKAQLISVHYLQNGDNITILPLLTPTKAHGMEDIAKLFVFFPLLGTEKWGVNFIFHSKFSPLEPRNGIILPCDNVNVAKDAERNKQIVADMTSSLHGYLTTHAANIENAIELATVNFPLKLEDKFTQSFYNQQQELWTNAFRRLPLIETSDGRKCLNDGVKVFSAEICEFFGDEGNRANYYDSFYEYASSAALLPNKEICLRWSHIVHNWRLSDVATYIVNLNEVAAKVSAVKDFARLKQLLHIIKECKQTKLFTDYAIIPNREGELKTAEELRDGKSIPAELYNRAKRIAPDEMYKLVHEDFTEVYSFSAFSRENLKQAIAVANDRMRKQTLKSDQPVCFSNDYTDALRKYASIYMSNGLDNYRHRIMTCLSKMKGFAYQPVVVPKTSESEDPYIPSFIYLLESELLDITHSASLDAEWLINNRTELLTLISQVSAIKDSEYAPRLLGTYKVIPNQQGALCCLDTLRRREDAIIDELADLYNKACHCEDKRAGWVDSEFAQFVPSDKIDLAKDLASDVQKVLLDEYEESGHTSVNPLILEIIQHIEAKDGLSEIWKGWFRQIENNKADLNWHMVPDNSKLSFYRLMKVAGNQSLLSDLADLSENPHRMNDALQYLRQQDEARAEFDFKHALGKHIEGLIRNKLGDELGNRLEIVPTIEDRQCGQDIVIRYGDRDVFFIECKAKKSFNEQAHMSKAQMLKACEENGRYALCAVDLTGFVGLSNGVFPDVNDLDGHIHIHLDIADKLQLLVNPLRDINEEWMEDQITLSTHYVCNIPKKVFVNHQGIEILENAIIEEISKFEP